MKKFMIAFIAAAFALTSVQAWAGDADKGAKVWRKCRACHSLEVGSDHKLGPNLGGLFGRIAGSAAGYAQYSTALRNSGIHWDETSLDAFLAKPGKVVPGNAMTYPGLRKDGQRADLIAYLKVATR